MSHRNNDNNGPWNNRNSRNNDGGGDGGGRGGGGGGGNYKDRNWGGNNRYGMDNRYNNKERRNYRGYGGRRNYDGRPYRPNAWNNNGGIQDGSYPRYQNNWHQKHPGSNKLGAGLGPEPDPMQQQIPPLMINFDVDSADPPPPQTTQQQRGEVASSGNAPAAATKVGADSTNGSSTEKPATERYNGLNAIGR